jgi:hypothetical protein
VSIAQTNVIELAPSSPLPPPWLNGHAHRMTLRQPEAVKAFLEENHFLIPVIEEASVKLVEYFGAETPLVLEIRSQAEDEGSELFLYVKTDLPVPEALTRLDRFDEEWWLDEMGRSRNLMVIKLGYA